MSGKKNQKRSTNAEYRRVVRLLTNHFATKQHTSYERHIFRKDERVDEFVIRLRIQAERWKRISGSELTKISRTRLRAPVI